MAAFPVNSHPRRAGPEGDDMLSKEDTRRLAQMERQLRRQDPEFCARMLAGGQRTRRRPPFALAIAAAMIWIAALVFSVVGWWLVAAACALWATLVVCALACRWRPVESWSAQE
jgi:fatty acid desaturase